MSLPCILPSLCVLAEHLLPAISMHTTSRFAYFPHQYAYNIIIIYTHHNHMYAKLQLNSGYLSFNHFLVSFFCATCRLASLSYTHPLSSCTPTHKVYYTHSYTYHVLIMPYIYPYWYHLYCLYIVQSVTLHIHNITCTGF